MMRVTHRHRHGSGGVVWVQYFNSKARHCVLSMQSVRLLLRATTPRWSGAMRFSSSLLPIEPSSFIRGIVIDKNGKKENTGFFIDRSNDGELLLETQNPHEMDSRIVFNEDTHEYYFDGKLLDKSCTGVVSQFFKKFDPDLVVEKMMSGKNWPSPAYTFPDGTPYTAERIKGRWDRTKEYSMNYGIWMHYNIERYFNNLKPSEKLAEMKQFYDFEKKWISEQGVTPLRTEWKIAVPEWGLGGTVDFLGRKVDGSYVIMDWKRSLKLEQSLNNSFNIKAKPPLQSIDDCDGCKYFLQLNLYKRVLEHTYKMKISSMVLASFHEKNDGFMAIEVPDMTFEIDAIIATFDKSRDDSESPDELA